MMYRFLTLGCRLPAITVYATSAVALQTFRIIGSQLLVSKAFWPTPKL